MDHTAISATSTLSRHSLNNSRRIQAIDTLRGFALLGILIMNIPHFAGPFVLHNPTAYGNFAGMEEWIWNLSHILADQKFMTIFSPLYGAGILLLISRLEQRVGAYKVAFFARSIWLLLFGLAHYFLLWEGDILITYALAGMVAYFFRGAQSFHSLGLGSDVRQHEHDIHFRCTPGSAWGAGGPDTVFQWESRRQRCPD